MSNKRPAFQFYPKDWRGDFALRSCSLAARGLWIEMLALMHDGQPYGHLRVNSVVLDDRQLATIVGASVKETRRLLRELEEAGVFSRTADGVIYSRRMVRDEETRRMRAIGGRSSLKNPRVPRPKDASKDPLSPEGKDEVKDILQGYPQGRYSGPSPAFAFAFAGSTDEGNRSVFPFPSTGEGTSTLPHSAMRNEGVSLPPPAPAPSARRRAGEPRPARAPPYPQAFEGFWAAYPRKVEKARAYRVWEARRREGAAPEDMERAARHYAQWCRDAGTEPAYIKHAATFLGPSRSFLEWVEGPPEPVPAGSARAGRGLSARDLMQRALSEDEEEAP